MYCPYKPEELVAKEIEYFWPGVIAYGFPAYINGSTGLGKTNVFLKVMADATNGIFPPGVGKYALEDPVHGEPIRCFYVSTENPVSEIVYPALIHNGADTGRIKIQKEEEGHFTLCMEDLQVLYKDFTPKLIIIDAFQEHLPDGCSLSDGEHMSEVMREMEHFAYENKVALVLIGNDAKGTEGRSDANKLLGSGVIARRARSLITVKESKGERYLKVTKRLGFTRKEDTMIGYQFGDDEKLEFYLYDGCISEELEPEDEYGAGDNAEAFLLDLLSDGSVDSKEVKRLAIEAGIAIATLNRAKKRLGIRSRRLSNRSSLWVL